jgi:drug/metabolite transporter (DMT)-like permease
MTPAAVAKRNRLKVLLAFAAVYVLWGATYLFIKYAIETIPPFTLGVARYALAALLLYPIARARAGQGLTRAELGLAVISGTLMLGFGNGGVIWAEQTVASGVVALIVASVPIWIAVIDWLRPGGVRPRKVMLLGLALGFGGILILIGPRALVGSSHIDLRGVAVLLVGSIAWSTGTLLTRGKKPGSPFVFAAVQMAAAAVAFAVPAIATGELQQFDWGGVSARSYVSLVYLVIAGSIIAFTAYVYLLGVVSAAKAATYAYVNPIVAVVLGWLFANEPIGLRTLAAAAVILGSVALITSAQATPSTSTGENPVPTPTPKEHRPAA